MRPIKKAIVSLTILLISILYFQQLANTQLYAQESRFIIRLRSGVEIKAEKILIEDDVVFYLFSTNERKSMGISKESVAEIIEREKRSGKEIIIFPQERDSESKFTK